MDLQISVFLLFILFTAGHSLKCYECNGLEGSCANQTELTCPSGSTHCQSLTGVTHFGDITYKEKYKECVLGCQSGSINFGIIRMTISCCNTDLCNLQDAPDPSNVPNGKTCYYCDGLTCSHTLNCSEDEDRCITATVTSGDQTVELKGCVSKSFCGARTSVRNVRSTTCCEGNMCNGAQSVTQSSTYNTVTQTSAYNGAQSVSQSFLFLCCSLLSYFLLH